MRSPLLLGLGVLLACGGARAGVEPAAPVPAVAGGGAGAAPPPSVPPPVTPTPPPEPARPLIGAAWPLTERALAVAGAGAMVVSSHAVASGVGGDILRQGGNAVGAAVAGGVALAVARPSAGHMRGGGLMLVRLARGR